MTSTSTLTLHLVTTTVDSTMDDHIIGIGDSIRSLWRDMQGFVLSIAKGRVVILL
jgi:hypothetical protein